MWRTTLPLLLFAVLALSAGIEVDYPSACANYPYYIPEPLLGIKNASKVLKIGAFGTFDTIPAAIPMYNLAVSVINNRTDILEDVEIQLLVANIFKSSSNALLAPQSLIYSNNVSALLGGIYSSETRIGQLVARINNVPEISSTPLSTLLSNKIEYPYLVRVNPIDTTESQAIADMFAHYGWMQALVIYCDDEFCTYGLSNMQQYTKARNVNLYYNQISTGQTNFTDNVNFIQTLVTQKNIKIFVMYTQSAETLLLMTALEEAGLTGGEYIYIHTSGSALIYLSTNLTPNSSFVGSVVVGPRGPVPSSMYDNYLDLWNTYGTDADTGGFAWYYLDAVLLLANAVDMLLKSGIDLEHISGQMLLTSIINTNTTGVTGPLTLDSSHDRLGEFVWYSIGPSGINRSNASAIYNPLTGKTIFNSKLVWNGDPSLVPSDGLNNQLAYDEDLAIGLGVLVAIAMLLSVFAALMLYYYWSKFQNHGSLYCAIIIVGTFFAYISALLLLPEQTDSLCLAFPWLLGIGFTLTYGCLFIKTWALFSVWNAATKLERSSITIVTVIKGIGLYLAIECIFLLIWTMKDPPTLRTNKLVTGKYEKQCESDSVAFWVVFVVIKGIWLISGAFFSFITRDIATEYSESKSIAYATYNNTLLCALAVPLGLTLRQVPHGTVAIQVVIIVLAFSFTTFFLFFDIWAESLFPSKSTESPTVGKKVLNSSSAKKSSSSSLQSSVSSKEVAQV